ncbi:nucleic-acid-binding protein from transposon X-element [Nephila pilipes]|uniref:Nucleic-acid-binding protein from transposon X-element n=1 Tax=Nephila pilipes TaxID=299642 RepID=A0A8X6NAA0_NEPPI|nr:nucleic-acid-binding protein from transposon X-element [Nephila pilipes]
MSLEVEEFPSLTNNNEDVSQTMESNSNQETNSDNEEEIEPLTAEINKKRIPPIIIDESVNTPALMDEICTLLGFKIMARMVNGKLKVFPETIDAHRKIQNFISVKKLKSHTFEMLSEKQLKIIIRGLPIDYDQTEILEEIRSHGVIGSCVCRGQPGMGHLGKERYSPSASAAASLAIR